MGKKAKGQKTVKPEAALPADEPLSALGKKVIAGGVVSIVAGFFALSRTDPMGQNLASTLAPFLILGGYAVVAVGIFVPQPQGGGQTPPSAPPSNP